MYVVAYVFVCTHVLELGRNAYLLDKAKFQVAVRNHPAAPLVKVKYTPIVHRGDIRCVRVSECIYPSGRP